MIHAPRRQLGRSRSRHRLHWGLMVAVCCWLGSSSAWAEVKSAQASELAVERLLLGAARAGDRLVAVGEWGHIVLSDDLGQSWHQARSVPTRMTLTSVFFVDDQRGWAVGHDAMILHSADGGESWQPQHSDPEQEVPLLSVWFEDAQHGIAVGAFSTTLETGDGGQSWQSRPLIEGSETDLHLNQIFGGGEGQVFIAAEAGTVYRSRDSGRIWEALFPGYEGSFWGGLGLGDGALLVWGMRGHVFRSEDFGESWQEVESNTDQSLQGGTLLSNGQVVLVGLGGVVLRSSDRGRTFAVGVQPDRLGIAAVAEAAPGRVMLFGEQGVEEPESWPANEAPEAKRDQPTTP